MPGRSSERSRQNAAFMKERGIERTTGACPMGCGRPVKNGGEHLLNHLKMCRGKTRGRKRG